MITENGKTWLAALRSGIYKQNKGALRSGDKFCCLGVASDISKVGEWIPSDGEDILYDYKSGPFISFSYLHPAVSEWLGISHRSRQVELPEDSIFEDLAEANDGELTFSEIADLIEKHADYIFGGGNTP